MKSHYKIVHTSCQDLSGDLENHIFNESVWMEKNGHKIIIVAPRDTPLFLKARRQGMKVYGVDFKLSSMINNYKLLKNIFYNEKPDIINTHGKMDSRLALSAAKKLDIPCRILSKHDSTPVKNSWYNRMVYKKFPHYIFTSSDHTTKHLQKIFKLSDMQVFSIPGGIVEPRHLLDKTMARKGLAKELGLDPGTRFIGFVGEISPGKGISNILEAFKKIQPKLPGHHIAIVGKGEDDHTNHLKDMAKKLQIGHLVHFTGFRKNTHPYYRALDCSILAPVVDLNQAPVEETRLKALQAMICECPVIGPKSACIVDIIDPEKTGLLFETSDPCDLADKILYTLLDKDETRKRFEAARDLVKNQHTIDVVAKGITRIYNLHQVKLDRQRTHIS